MGWVLGVIAAAVGWQWYLFNKGPTTKRIALGKGYTLTVRFLAGDSGECDWNLSDPNELNLTGGHATSLEEAMLAGRGIMTADIAARKLTGA